MIIVEKNPGQKIDYEVNKTKLTFDDDLTLNLAKREEDYAVHIDVCFDEDEALRRFEDDEIVIEVSLGTGGGADTRVWTCDLTHEYIHINADYRS